MKKHSLPILAIVILLITVFTLTSASAFSIGDVDGNGKLEAADARKVLRASVSLETLTAQEEMAADVDGVPGITAADARLILRASVSLEVLEDPHTHSYVETVTKAATCTENGVRTFSCTCGEGTYTETVPATGHSYDKGVITLPTCTVDGYTTYTCGNCSHSYKDSPVTAKGHKEVTDAAKAATCTATGLTAGKHCSVCGTVTVPQTTIAAKGHDAVTHGAKAATCTAIGWNAYVTCSRCDYTTYKEIAKLGHDEVAHGAKAATCTAIGWNAYVTCSRCDYTTYKEIAKLGHSEVAHVAKAATCTAIGWNAYVTCSRCDYTTYKEIAKLGHNEVAHVAKAATCTAIGWNAYVTCSRYDYTTYDEIPALGHSADEEGDVVVTCLADGYCTRCESKVISPGKHNTVSKTVGYICTEPGYTVDVCTECDYYENVQYPEDLKGPGEHSFDEENFETVENTCTERGYKEKTCTAVYWIENAEGVLEPTPCGVSEKYDYVDASGHDYEWQVTKEETCKTTGSRTGTCAECGDELIEVIPMSPHTTARSAENLPGTKGSDDYCKLVVKCTECGEILLSKDNDGHVIDPSTYVPNEVPEGVSSCTVDSTATVGCKYCDYINKEYFVSPAPGHKGNIASVTKATCTESGWMDIDECTVCGEEFHDGYVIPATGHTYSGIATCTTDVKCSVCHEVVEEKLGHEFTMFAAAYNTEIEQFCCSRCGEVTDDKLTAFNNIANKIKGTYFLTEFNKQKVTTPEIIRFGKTSVKTEYSRFDFGIYTSAIKRLYEEEMANTPDTYLPVRTNGTLRNMLPLEYSAVVSLLEASDVNSIKVEKLNGINVRDVLSVYPDTYTVGSTDYSIGEYKKNINEEVIKVTVDVKDESYSQIKSLSANEKTSLQKILGLDIRDDVKEFTEENGKLILREVDTGDGYSIAMEMELREITSDATVTYYFAADTYEPILAVYSADIGMEQTIDMDFSIGLFSLDGELDPTINTNYNYVYLFPNYFA